MHNRSLVLQYLAGADTITRVTLAEKTGLQQATISKIIATMIELGIVREEGMTKGRMGRRSIALAFNYARFRVVAVKLAREAFIVGTFDLKGNHLEIYSEAIDRRIHKPDDVIHRIHMEIRRQAQKHGGIYAIGVAVPGPYMKTTGQIALMSEFPGWANYNIASAFNHVFDVPVIIEHDANAGAFALWKFGPYQQQGVRTLFHFLVSEGVGAGIICDGAILSGAHGIAGEVGHMSINTMSTKRCACGNYGCLEMYCSAHAMVSTAREWLARYPASALRQYPALDAGCIFRELNKGDQLCVDLVTHIGRHLGAAIVNIVNIYDPDVIVLSDIMTGGGEVMMAAIRETVQARIRNALRDEVRVEYCTSSIDPILCGAAVIAINHLLENPPFFQDAQQPPLEEAT